MCSMQLSRGADLPLFLCTHLQMISRCLIAELANVHASSSLSGMANHKVFLKFSIREGIQQESWEHGTNVDVNSPCEQHFGLTTSSERLGVV